MDNFEQIKEILKYKRYLYTALGVAVDRETAAKLWIIKYAALWREVKRCRNAKPAFSGNYSVVTRISIL